MSNSQRPPGSGPQSPWASQDPSWHPTQFQDAHGRDPRQPFGQQAPPPSSYQELEPPKRSNGALFAVLAVVAVIAALVLGMQFLGGTAPEESASPAVATSSPTPERTGNFIPFEGNGDGVFEILDYTWTGDQLNLRVRVEVEQGEYAFAVFAFTNESRMSYDPVDMRAFTVRADQPYEGDVTFVMPNADSTIVLTTPSGRVALNALPVRGS